MTITITITPKQEKILKHVYKNQNLNANFQAWFNEWIEHRVDKLLRSRVNTKTLNQKIDEITK